MIIVRHQYIVDFKSIYLKLFPVFSEAIIEAKGDLDGFCHCRDPSLSGDLYTISVPSSDR
jgi:hypothetical protein